MSCGDGQFTRYWLNVEVGVGECSVVMVNLPGTG